MRIVIGRQPDLKINESLKLVRNAIRCRKCNEIIESKSVHHFVQCSCHAVGVDGGLEYDRIMGDSVDYEQLQEWLITELDKDSILDEKVFYGLTNLNTGFDVQTIKYFSESDFEIVLQRVKRLGLGVTGIEPFKDGKFYGVEVYEEFTDDSTDPNWYMDSFKRFRKTGETLQYSATYYVPGQD
jgi:hypothetical protein